MEKGGEEGRDNIYIYIFGWRRGKERGGDIGFIILWRLHRV